MQDLTPPQHHHFYLAHTWTTAELEDGSYQLEVEATDLGGNTGMRRQPFTVANNV
jgi:hypothetical protein